MEVFSQMQVLCLFSVEALVRQGVETEMPENANTDFRAYSSFIPTKHRFNRPPECRKDKSNSNTMKLFSLLRHKAESLAGNGGGGGPAGEDLNTAEEINCRLLVVVHYRSSGKSLELVLAQSLVRGLLTVNPYRCDCCFVQRSRTACTLAAAPSHKPHHRWQKYHLYKHKRAL